MRKGNPSQLWHGGCLHGRRLGGHELRRNRLYRYAYGDFQPAALHHQYNDVRKGDRNCHSLAHSNLRREAFDRHRDRHDRRQGAHSRGAHRQHAGRDRRGQPGRPADDRPDHPGDRHDGDRARDSPGAVAHVEAGPAAGCRGGGQRAQRQYPSGRQAGCVAPAGELPVRAGDQRSADDERQSLRPEWRLQLRGW